MNEDTPTATDVSFFDTPQYDINTTFPQRDPRTSYASKQLYVVWMFLTTLMAVMSVAGIFVIYRDCPCTTSADTGFWYFAMAFTVLLALVFIVNLLAMCFPTYMWRRAQVNAECMGLDVEDCDPLRLREDASAFKLRALETML